MPQNLSIVELEIICRMKKDIPRNHQTIEFATTYMLRTDSKSISGSIEAILIVIGRLCHFSVSLLLYEYSATVLLDCVRFRDAD